VRHRGWIARISAGAASVGTLTGSGVGGHRGRQARRVRHTTDLALRAFVLRAVSSLDRDYIQRSHIFGAMRIS
jgi:hypothetical protein